MCYVKHNARCRIEPRIRAPEGVKKSISAICLMLIPRDLGARKRVDLEYIHSFPSPLALFSAKEEASDATILFVERLRVARVSATPSSCHRVGELGHGDQMSVIRTETAPE